MPRKAIPGSRNSTEPRKSYLKAWNLAHKTERDAYRRRYRRQDIRNQLKACYGIDFLTYSAMLISQNGLCSCCGDQLRHPHVDHDHADGKVRGLLCRGCNTVLGHAKDSIPRLMKAVDFLRRFE